MHYLVGLLLRLLFLNIALFFLLPFSSFGQSAGVWLFESNTMLKPFRAEPRAPMAKISAGWSSDFAFHAPVGTRNVFDIQLGAEISVIGKNTEGGKPIWGAWIPVSFHLIFDNEDMTAPLVNSDNRFGITFKRQWDLGERWILGARFTPWMHESPHLGDEFSLAAQGTDSTFRRINVAYEFAELNVQAQYTRDRNVLRLRLGAARLWANCFTLGGRNQSFYWTSEFEINGIRTTLSNQRWEYWGVGLEYEYNDINYKNKHWWSQWYPYISIDFRERVRFEYDKPVEEEDRVEQLVGAFNLIIGFNHLRPIDDRRGRFAIFFNYYKGLNPHGQFRNLQGYSYRGFGLMVYL